MPNPGTDAEHTVEEPNRDAFHTIVKAEASQTRPTETVDELQIAAEYVEHSSLGGPLFSIILIGTLAALGIVAWMYFS